VLKIKKDHPKKDLFEGQNGGDYLASSVANILKKVAIKAGIRKNVTPQYKNYENNLSFSFNYDELTHD